MLIDTDRLKTRIAEMKLLEESADTVNARFAIWVRTSETGRAVEIVEDFWINECGDIAAEMQRDNLKRVIAEINEATLGWMNYYRLSQVKGVFEELDQWIRRKLRCILWRQWKKPWTRFKKMMTQGLEKEERARCSAFNGRGPWWNSGASHMNACVTAVFLRGQGLTSSLYTYQCFA